MIRVNRHAIAGALVAGVALLSMAPAQAQVEPPLQVLVESQPDPQAIADGGIFSGSADLLAATILKDFFCGTIWRTCV